MKQSFKMQFSAALVSSLLAAISWANGPKYEAGTYKVDPAHSKVGFEVTHLKISTVEGKFKDFEGQIDLAEKFEKSKVTASVKIDSIDTGVEKRDGHLKSPDFFESAKFATMTFKSTAVSGSPESFKLTGDLTIKGKTKPVTFDAKFLGSAADGYGNQKLGFSAKAKISRKDFGLTWNNMVEGVSVVSDDVEIILNLQAGRPLPAKK